MLTKYGILLVFCICSVVYIATSGCPIGCYCLRPRVVVLCESLGLKSLPHSVPLNTAVLSVAENQLCNMDHVLRPFTSLQELSISHNLLARFPRGLPPSLEGLFLQRNCITYITLGHLRQLRNLTRLDLRDNHIRAIQPGALQSLKNLQVLMLKGNKLTSLSPNLPASLTNLDLSTKCILALPSFSTLNVLKISSNCLRSILDSNFDKVPHLRSVDCINNLRLCKCDISHLQCWMLSSRLRMTSTYTVCTEPVHLTYCPVLNLSLAGICPGALKSNAKTPQVKALTVNPVSSWVLNSLENNLEAWLVQQIAEDTSAGQLPENKATVVTVPVTWILDEHLYLHTLIYEDCFTLNTAQTMALSHSTPSPYDEKRHNDNTTIQYSQMITTHPAGTRASFFTKNDSTLSTPNLLHSVFIWLLVALCVLLLLLMLLLLLVLKKALQRQQRVAPLDRDANG